MCLRWRCFLKHDALQTIDLGAAFVDRAVPVMVSAFVSQDCLRNIRNVFKSSRRIFHAGFSRMSGIMCIIILQSVYYSAVCPRVPARARAHAARERLRAPARVPRAHTRPCAPALNRPCVVIYTWSRIQFALARVSRVIPLPLPPPLPFPLPLPLLPPPPAELQVAHVVQMAYSANGQALTT